MAADYPRRGGRTLRASLCIATAEAFGAPAELSLDSAVSIELLHNAFLVHDDIEDDSDERRGRPTLHRTHGVADALNAADALTVMGMDALLANCTTLGPRISQHVLQETHAMARETVEGQALELAFRSRKASRITAANYLRMTLKKTCWYTVIHPCRVGALIGSGLAADPERFVKYGFFLGAAFQIQDDLLNLVGDPARYGKERNGDLFEGKRTLLLSHTFARAGARDRRRLDQLLSLPRKRRTARDIRWIRQAIEEHGSIAYARSVARALAGAASHEFDRAFAGALPGSALTFLAELPAWIIERS
jgi:geranylgeranyl diphosphate synthase type II